MTMEKALAALDAAFTQKIEKLFDILSNGQDLAPAVERFASGFSNTLDAYAVAKAVIERKLPE